MDNCWIMSLKAKIVLTSLMTPSTLYVNITFKTKMNYLFFIKLKI